MKKPSESGRPHDGTKLALLAGAVGLVAAVTLTACERDGGSASAASAAASAAPPDWLEGAPKKRLVVGDEVTGFEAVTHNGLMFRLADYPDKPVLVVFIEGATPAGIADLSVLRDGWLLFNQTLGATLAVAPGDHVSHRAFASEQKLPFLMASEEESHLRAAFGATTAFGAPARMLFLVGKDRRITHVFVNLSGQGYVPALRAALDDGK